MSTFNHSSTRTVVVNTARGGAQNIHVDVDGFHFDDAGNLVITNGERTAAMYARMHWVSVIVQESKS